MALEAVFRYIERRGRRYPIIPIRLLGAEPVTVYALVDSGAVVSLFHSDIAEYAGLDLGRAEPVYLAGVGGYVRALLMRDVEIEVEGIGRLSIPIAFTDNVSADISILGRKGFFEALEVTFRERREEIVLRRTMPGDRNT